MANLVTGGVAIPSGVATRMVRLLCEMRDSHKALEEDGHITTFHLEALDFVKEATDIMEELNADEAAYDAATIGFQIRDVVGDILSRLPRTALEWGDHGINLAALEQIYEAAEDLRLKLTVHNILRHPM